MKHLSRNARQLPLIRCTGVSTASSVPGGRGPFFADATLLIFLLIFLRGHLGRFNMANVNGLVAPIGYRIENGYLWPARDVRCADYIFKSLGDLDGIYPYCTAFDVVVQAGGNCGVWARELSQKFARVYTFEPCPVNFRCLAANAPQENVFKFNAALGNQHKLVRLNRNPLNVGAHFIEEGAGEIPTMRLDDLCLDTCNLLLLDVEGFEIEAIRGGWETIKRCKPIVVAEERGYSIRYGRRAGDLEALLRCSHIVVARTKYDLVLLPK